MTTQPASNYSHPSGIFMSCQIIIITLKKTAVNCMPDMENTFFFFWYSPRLPLFCNRRESGRSKCCVCYPAPAARSADFTTSPFLGITLGGPGCLIQPCFLCHGHPLTMVWLQDLSPRVSGIGRGATPLLSFPQGHLTLGLHSANFLAPSKQQLPHFP